MSASVTNGIDYVLGRACWHVVGYVNGDPCKPRLLCGKRLDICDIGGSSVDVAKSLMYVCRTCDRATGGHAAQIDGSGAAS